MFDKATKLKLRFDSQRGALTTEDLWDLLLTNTNGVNLDRIAVALSRQIKDEGEESFVSPKPKNETLHLKLDIVKHVIAVKLEEAKEVKTRAERKAQKDRIIEIIAAKQDEVLANKPMKELQKMIADLD